MFRSAVCVVGLFFFYQNAIICYWCVGLSGPMNVKRTNQQKNNTKWQIMKKTKKQICFNHMQSACELLGIFCVKVNCQYRNLFSHTEKVIIYLK